MTLASSLSLVCLALATAASAQDPPPAHEDEFDSAPGVALDPDLVATLPDAPAKGIVLVQCNKCHGLEWVERSGADLDGWTDRLRRMIRAGAQIPPEQVPLLAEYLAKALPERPRPPPEYSPKPHIKP